MKTKLLLLPLFACALTLTACNSNDSSEETLYKDGTSSYTSTDLVTDTQEIFGGNSLEKTMLYNILNEKYPADKNQVEVSYTSMIDSYGSERELLNVLKSNGLTKEQYKNSIAYEVSYSKALNDIAKPKKADLKKLYEKYKQVSTVTQIRVSKVDEKGYKKTVKSIEADIKEGKSTKELTEKYGKTAGVQVTDSEFTNALEFAVTKDVLALKKGEYHKEQSDVNDNVVTFYAVQDIRDADYNTVEPTLVSQYHKEKGIDTVSGMLNYFVKKDKLELQNFYKDMFK